MCKYMCYHLLHINVSDTKIYNNVHYKSYEGRKETHY